VTQEIKKLRESLGGHNLQERRDSQMLVVGGYQMVPTQEDRIDQEPIVLSLAAMEMIAT
jgi:hypothetical protein